MGSTDDVQAAVDQLARSLGQSVLIEDREQRPVWWATVGPIDGTRSRTILNRVVQAPAAAVVPEFRLRRAERPVRTPANPEAEMWARWAVPVRHNEYFLGLLWVLDPDESFTENDLQPAVDCAEIAGLVLSQQKHAGEANRLLRQEMLDRLVQGPDEAAARELARLERVAHDVEVQVEAPGVAGGWMLDDDMTVHVVIRGPRLATSGAPVPLIELGEAVRRARATRRVLAAGARIEPPTWESLGPWHLIVAAPDQLRTEMLHPAAVALIENNRNDLLETARVIVDNGGDVSSAAQELHVHRTTLYYRVERIKELTGADLQDGRTRSSLQLALWHAAYRAAGP